MKRRYILLVTLPYLSHAQSADYSQYVDPFHGTEGDGNIFPGVVAAPFAMVKLGPDVQDGNRDAYSGYLPNGNIFGFSMMHESGTGGAPKYGVVNQMPVLGQVENPLADLSVPRAEPDRATVGYYRSALENGVIVELAGTEHAGLYQYTFPTGQSTSVVIDVSHVLHSFRGMGWDQTYARGQFNVFEDGHYEGSGTYNGGWNLAPDWTIHFCGHFSATPQVVRTFSGVGDRASRYDASTSASGTERLGGVFTFGQGTVTSRVGISFISTAKACQNVNNEIPPGTELPALVSRAVDRWNTDVFSKVATTDTVPSNLQQLYGSLYGMHMLPSNRTGENPGWASDEPYYDDWFTLWDTFRCTTPLVQILQPAAYEEQIRALIDIWRYDGFLPDARSSNFNGRTQGGSNADNILADAYVKGVRGAVNWGDGYAAMVTDAESVPEPNNDLSARDSSTKHGRGALPDWLQYGYITPKYTRAVTRAMEYAGNDFGLYQVANGLNMAADAEKYLGRSRNWRNHWNRDVTSLGFSGFVVPRNTDGSFVEQDPLKCGGCYWAEPYYQGLPWEYSMAARHDMATLVGYAGGPETFVRRLDKMFEPGIDPGNPKFNGTIVNPGNQPSFATPYLYNFAGRQDRSVERSRFIAKNYYNPGVAGLPGNSDAGSMQSWLLWNMIGLYPLTGQTTFLIGSPWFESLTIDLGGGKRLDVTSTGGNSNTAYYVQSLEVNGQPWDKAWVSWSDVFENGGSMAFVLGPEPRSWATGELPPNPASGGM
ncbi:hypothetical protein W97_01873 [Coniosporium apollinis CBS 100218]|uniref:Alpha-1,2-mannosidase n=1 Tax=Coniosporium apollinis (strain CBS 100218) TaxID=1168221 RepID=R7YLH4_CONA1|nr:uncharacterized protein W97_01873 [Coniosporium apollinis CBS 100218]EON62649.1 hypothetical protein W97_01873 [Coniosporium apollinis CBS 100218]